MGLEAIKKGLECLETCKKECKGLKGLEVRVEDVDFRTLVSKKFHIPLCEVNIRLENGNPKT